jgi:phosphoribosylamine--glycine ligase
VASVAVASGGYPGDYPKGLPITGIDEAEKLDDVVIFHAGTAVKDGQLVTAGGRVLNVTAIGPTLDEALSKTYAAVKLIHFEGMHYRTDIGRRPV